MGCVCVVGCSEGDGTDDGGNGDDGDGFDGMADCGRNLVIGLACVMKGVREWEKMRRRNAYINGGFANCGRDGRCQGLNGGHLNCVCLGGGQNDAMEMSESDAFGVETEDFKLTLIPH